MTFSLAIDIGATRTTFARWGPGGLDLGVLPGPGRWPVDVAANAPLRTRAPRHRAAAVMLMSLRDCCVLPRLPKPVAARPRQVRGAVRFQVATALKRERAPEAVTVDYTETPSGLLASGAPVEVLTPLIGELEAGGLRVAAVEPAMLALLRAVCFADRDPVLVLRLGDTDAELAVGSGVDVLLVRRVSWSAASLEQLALEVDETLREAANLAGGVRPQTIFLAGEADWTPLADRLRRRAQSAVEMARLHPGWSLPKVPPTHVAVVGALIEPQIPSLRRKPCWVFPFPWTEREPA